MGKKEIHIACKGSSAAPIESLKEFQGNLKDLSTENYEKLKKEILELGFSEPISVWFNKGVTHVINGHQRLRVVSKMIEEGYSCPKLPVCEIEAKNLKEAKLKVLALTSQYGEITNQGLYEFIENSKISFDEIISSFRFPEIDLEGFRTEFYEDAESTEEQDEVPSVRKTKIKTGDLFLLGNHRLLCGDSTDPKQIKKLMNKKTADMLFTDPPYGVDYEGVNNDHLKAEKLREFIASALKAADEHIRPGACFYIWHPDIHSYEFIGAVREAGWQQARPSVIQWVKDSLVLSQGDYHSRNEPCLYGWKPGAGHKRVEDRTQDTLWECPKPKRSEEHPTMKPVELCERAIKNSSELGWVVLDLFLGSGSTLIACEKINRSCFGVELDPQYCQVIIDRWEEFSGKKATKST